MPKLIAIALTLASVLAVGCETTPKTDKPDDILGTWHFASLEAAGEAPVSAPEVHFIPKITFEPIGEYEKDGRVTGFTGVNRFFGDYQVIDGAIEMSDFGSTRMAGPPDRMELETKLLGALDTVSTYRADREQLELDYDRGMMIFTRVPGG